MSEENTPADDFLLKIDQDKKALEEAEQSLYENRKQRAQKMFDEVAPAIDKYLHALGKRHFGTDNYAIKHVFNEFSTAYWMVFSVEKKDWNTEMRYSGEDKDFNLYEYKFAEGFKVDLVYSSEGEQGFLDLFNDGAFIPFSEHSLQDYISKIHQIGPRELWGHF